MAPSVATPTAANRSATTAVGTTAGTTGAAVASSATATSTRVAAPAAATARGAPATAATTPSRITPAVASVSTIGRGGDTTIPSPGRSPKHLLPGIGLHAPFHGRQACLEFNSFHQGVGQISPREGLFSCCTLPKRGQICDIPFPPQLSLEKNTCSGSRDDRCDPFFWDSVEYRVPTIWMISARSRFFIACSVALTWHTHQVARE